MKVLVLCALVAAAAAWPQLNIGLDTRVGHDVSGVSTAQKQHDINHLLYKVYGSLRDANLKTLADTFDPLADTSRYVDGGEVVRRFMGDLEGQRLLRKREEFLVLNERHLQEGLTFFDVLMRCKDWATITGTAAYFRQRLNEVVFAGAFYYFVKHSPLTQSVVLPPFYEIMPEYYTPTDIMREAYIAEMTSTPSKFRMNLTSMMNNPEQRVVYFTEDIGLSNYYLNTVLDYPFWWNDTHGQHIERKGETQFWIHHQLVNRYDAERISNGLQTVQRLRFDKPLEEGYAPKITYKSGAPFPPRPDNIYLEDVDGVSSIEDLILFERRFRDAIDLGYITTRDGSIVDIRNERGVDILGDVVESSEYSPNSEYYGSIGRTLQKVIARQMDPQGKYGMPPSVIESIPTCVYDPSFYSVVKRIDNLFREHKDSLPPYKKEELLFRGVAISNINIDGTLETYLEDYEYSLASAVYDGAQGDDVEISTYVPRLNHKDFSYNIDVLNNNDEEVLATMRIFAWPLRNSNGVKYSFDDGRWRAIELDKFMTRLRPGENQVNRKSTESSVTVPDRPSIKTLMERAKEALSRGTDMNLDQFLNVTGLPNRLLLPKGTESGMEFMLVVAVTDGEADMAVREIPTVTRILDYEYRGVYPDKKPHGYPLDRKVPDERVFYETPNIQGKIFKIYNHGEYLRYQ